MSIFKIFIVLIISLIIIVILSQTNKNYAIFVGMAFLIIALSFSISNFSVIYEYIKDLSQKANIEINYIEIILKISGICILCEFCSCLCEDANQKAMSFAIKTACKCAILVISIPIFEDILSLIMTIFDS